MLKRAQRPLTAQLRGALHVVPRSEWRTVCSWPGGLLRFQQLRCSPGRLSTPKHSTALPLLFPLHPVGCHTHGARVAARAPYARHNPPPARLPAGTSPCWRPRLAKSPPCRTSRLHTHPPTRCPTRYAASGKHAGTLFGTVRQSALRMPPRIHHDALGTCVPCARKSTRPTGARPGLPHI